MYQEFAGLYESVNCLVANILLKCVLCSIYSRRKNLYYVANILLIIPHYKMEQYFRGALIKV